MSPLHLQNGVADEVFGETEAEWMRVHLTPIKPRRIGLAMVSDWSKGMTHWELDGKMFLQLSWFYECDLYDAEHRRCTDWNNRPNICRGYPWYEDGPDDTKALPPECSFRVDIGLPVQSLPAPVDD